MRNRTRKKNRDIAKAVVSFYEYAPRDHLVGGFCGRTVHHIHAVIAIPIQLANRIWETEADSLCNRLQKDSADNKRISSHLFEPLRVEHEKSWLTYISKGKCFYE